ncbi:hypothetical protein BJ508DRAFT_301481 [Ascobolus immersus RN42]|uniref:Uncharacterized protein n=1 Tax=Ascobolus immersus RN42 TaxID=1160509 RepID=A0A3N4IKJ5_ASCIM|nr:hypothetical protein BJ508DRAFT_301481 [Ascobolus immersus RN42]
MKLTFTALLTAISLASATAIPAPALVPARVAISSAAPPAATPANARIAITAPFVELTPANPAELDAYLAASAVERVAEKRDISKRQSVQPVVYVCRDAPWVTSTCDQARLVPDGSCRNFQAEWIDSISSVGPNAGFYCQFYVDINCSGNWFGAVQPGYANLNVSPDGGFWNDKISSIKCWLLGLDSTCYPGQVASTPSAFQQCFDKMSALGVEAAGCSMVGRAADLVSPSALLVAYRVVSLGYWCWPSVFGGSSSSDIALVR